MRETHADGPVADCPSNPISLQRHTQTKIDNERPKERGQSRIPNANAMPENVGGRNTKKKRRRDCGG
jgi:hypothetical protein